MIEVWLLNGVKENFGREVGIYVGVYVVIRESLNYLGESEGLENVRYQVDFREEVERNRIFLMYVVLFYRIYILNRLKCEDMRFFIDDIIFIIFGNKIILRWKYFKISYIICFFY